MADDTMPDGMPAPSPNKRFKQCVAAARKRGINKPEAFCTKKGRNANQGAVALAPDGSAPHSKGG
jgi:hypothetical protein